MKTAIWARVLPLVSRRLAAPLGPRRYLFLLRLIVRWPASVAKNADPRDDEGLREYKRKLVWFVMIHDQLQPLVGHQEALRVALDITRSVAVLFQQQLYRPVAAPSLDGLIKLHQKQRREGPFRHIEYADVRAGHNRYDYRVTRCRFHEAFTAMGVPELTRAFCESDEIVFNDYVPGLHFDRGGRSTIARGATDCTFHFESSSKT